MKNSVCKSCSGTKFNQILDLNLSPPSNRLTLNEELYNSTSIYPLRLIKCSHCHLIQLDYFFDSSQLFDEQYPYLSSVSTYWVSHCKMLLKILLKLLVMMGIYKIFLKMSIL